jgi:GNAT superfamily N-acetyltransferase
MQSSYVLRSYENFIHDKYGYCYYSIEPEKNPIIFNLYTEPEYRRQGYAKKHLLFIINIIRNTGYVGQIHITAEPRENSIELSKLISFYKSVGLTIIN